MDWGPGVIAQIDDDYDRDNASDGQSRLGVYLADRRHLYTADTPAHFSDFAWQTATEPIMTPGYVRIRPDIREVRLTRRGDGTHLTAVITVPLSHTALRTPPPGGCQDWRRDWYATGYRGSYYPDSDDPTVLVTAELRIPLPEPLHTPAGKDLTCNAKAALRILIHQINRHAAPLVECLSADA